MKSTCLKTIALFIALSMVSGCAATGGGGDSSPTTSDAERTKNEGAALGALLGGLVGAVTGAAVSHDNPATGAAIGLGLGALGGGVAGYMYGKNAAERKQMYANEEDRLNGELKILKNYNAALAKRNTDTYQKIHELNERMRNLHARSQDLKNKAYLSAEEHQALLSTIQANESDIATYNQELNSFSQYGQELEQKGDQSKSEMASLEMEINLLRNHINTLDTNNKQMAKLAENLSVRK